MVTIGNDTLPGTITTIESATSTGANIGAPGDIVLVGPADLDNGTASADSVEKITRPKSARDTFGEPANSQLTVAIEDALIEGAYPVYAVAASETSVTGEDLSGLSTNTGTLANAPIREDTDEITFTIDGTTHTTVLHRDGDPHNVATSDIDADEVYVNPVTGKFQIDDGTTVGSAGDDVDYEYFSFTSAHEAIKTDQIGDDYVREIVDFVVNISENSTVRDDLETTVDEMETSGWLAIALAGPGSPYIADISTYTDSYDNSRLQLVYPSRNNDGETTLGSYAGKRASLGIDTSPIFKTINSQTDLQFTLDTSQQEDLVGAKVVPLEERSGGARIIEDLTTVADDNTTEEAWQQGFARLVTDHVSEVANDIAADYIGELHTVDARNALEGEVAGELQGLLESNAITAFSLIVEEESADTANVDIGINTTDPLRNINTTISAGAVNNGTTA